MSKKSKRIHVDSGSKRAGGFSEHDKQEAREFRDRLKLVSPGGWVLTPAPGRTATGFDLTQPPNVFPRSEKPVNPGQINKALLSELRGVDKRVVIVPEIYAHAAKKNVRFAAILPPGYDSNRKYPVVHLLPDPEMPSLGVKLVAGPMLERLKNFLATKDLSSAIVVLPEILTSDESAIRSIAERALTLDIQDYVAKTFNTEEKPRATFELPDFKAHTSETRSLKTPYFDDSGKVEKGEPAKPAAPKAPEKLPPNAIIMPGYWEYSVVSPEKLKLSDRYGTYDVPGPSRLEGLKKQDTASFMIPRVESKLLAMNLDVAVVLPPHFDVSRGARYPVQTVFAPPSGDLASMVKAMAAGSANFGDCVTIIIDPAAAKTAAKRGTSLDEVAANELLAKLEDSLNIDTSRYSSKMVGDVQGSSLVAAIRDAQSSPRKLPGPVVFTDGKWKQLLPTNDYKKEFPAVPSKAQTTPIPRELQQQPADSGTFFAPIIDSPSVKKPVRCGIYLPPGYDPSSDEKYPVLLMLPGRKNPISHYTTAGNLIPKLNRMMSGDAQKMIVVIPDNTDSFWFNYDKNNVREAGSEGGWKSEYAPKSEQGFGKAGSRDFEGMVLKDLLGYVGKELKGDLSRLSGAGISRGGFGVMSMEARHPGTFKSISSTAGVLDLQHEILLERGMAESVAGHFGPVGHPSWKANNPTDLIKAGAFKEKTPRIQIYVGAEDGLTLRDNLETTRLLRDREIKHEFAVVSEPKTEMKHDWDAWAKMLEEVIAFSQDTYGKPGQYKLPDGLKNVGEELVAKYVEQTKKDRKKLSDELKEIGPNLSKAAADLAEYASETEGQTSSLVKMREIEAKTTAQVLEKLIGTPDFPLHAAEKIVKDAKDLIASRDEIRDRIAETRLGKKPKLRETDAAALSRLPEEDRKDVEAVLQKIPQIKDQMSLLATLRPQILSGKDSVTGLRFASQLREMVEGGLIEKEDIHGLGEFLRRIAVRRFDWRRGGYSNVVCTAMNTFFNHPGRILQLIEAARLNSDLKVSGVFEGDGTRSVGALPIVNDLKLGFRSAPRFVIEHRYDPDEPYPAADYAYERGFLRVIRDTLGPNPRLTRMPPQYFGQTAGPIAVGLGKLTGKDVRYAYAFKLQRGSDLVEAMKSQGDEGLAMADVHVKSPDTRGKWVHLHFPVFYDFDPNTRTVAMQEWTREETRISVDNLEFAVYKKDNGSWEGPAVFYRPAPGMEKFLTPEHQSNWQALKACGQESSKGDLKPTVTLEKAPETKSSESKASEPKPEPKPVAVPRPAEREPSEYRSPPRVEVREVSSRPVQPSVSRDEPSVRREGVSMAQQPAAKPKAKASEPPDNIFTASINALLSFWN